MVSVKLGFCVLFFVVGRTIDIAKADEDLDDYQNDETDEMWATGSLDTIWEFLQCDEFHHNPARNPNAFPVHGHDTWKLLRHVYRRVVGEENSSLPPEEEDHVLSAFRVPFEIVSTPYKGRAVFATRDIEEGRLVWKSTFSAQFNNGADYRLFLQTIPPALACDVMEWAWSRFTSPEENQAVVCVDLEPSTFTNACIYNDECNHGFPDDMNPYGGCNVEFYASVPIARGDELLADYDDLSAGRDAFYVLGLFKLEDLYNDKLAMEFDDDDDAPADYRQDL